MPNDKKRKTGRKAQYGSATPRQVAAALLRHRTKQCENKRSKKAD